jgi:PAS domain S-box-containing protein
VTLLTLVIFVTSIWALAFYASRTLHEDMQRLVGEQQFSTVSLVAETVDEELSEQMTSLEQAAKGITPATLGNRRALQAFLEQALVFEHLFNAGVFVTRLDGTAIAEVPSMGRVGLNYMDRDHIAAALKEGKSTFGKPVIGKKVRAPSFAITVPIRDIQGQVIGAMAGATDLSKSNFLDKFTESRRDKTRYLLVAPQYRLVITATDQSRIMEELPAPGVNPMIDRFIRGYEGFDVVVNPLGEEVLASAKGVPVAGWYVATGLPTVEAFSPIREMLQRMLLATILLTVLAGGLTWWLLRRQLTPMVAAAKALASLSGTNLPPQPLPITHQDEVGELIGGFNRLLKTVRSREEELTESRDQLEGVYQSVGDAIVCMDEQQRIVLFNAAAERLFGYSVAEVIGQPLVILLPEHLRGQHEEHVRCFGAGEQSIRTMGTYGMVYGRRANGEEFPIETTISRSGISPDKVFTVILRDITERKQVEYEREQLSQQLESLSQRLATGQEIERHRIAHELHEELAQELITLKLYLQMIGSGSSSTQTDTQRKEALVLSLSAIERVRRLVLDLEPAELENFGIQAAARVYCERHAVAGGWNLHIDAPKPEVRAPKAVEQACFRVLQEGLSNVLQHAKATEVWVQVQQDADELVLQIRDGGIGFDYAAVGDAHKRGGVSLGLFGMQMRARQVGGSVEINSAAGAGTEVRARFPLSVTSVAPV